MHAATHKTVSPLLLSDQLITMAEQAGQAGYRNAARRLVALACQMLTQPPTPMPLAAPSRPPGARRRARRG